MVSLPPDRPSVKHALTMIDHQITGQARFIFVLLEIILVAASIDFPIDLPQIVTRNVLAMLGEFDGMTAQGATMQAGDQALRPACGREAPGADAGERFRIEVLLRFAHANRLSWRVLSTL
jgi:hypothetical protein